MCHCRGGTFWTGFVKPLLVTCILKFECIFLLTTLFPIRLFVVAHHKIDTDHHILSLTL